ncbi:MAG: peptide deformylase [Alphaproteobacteria bacterium]|jgi:peptide deformylase|nr:peptide deformylase [Alphaproteobacteria bacterium]
MAVRQIAKMGHPILRQIAEPIADPTSPDIAQLAEDMRETLAHIGASGIAAPQVFVSKRLVVYRMIAARIPAGSGIEPVDWTVLVNPEITPLTDETFPVWERCLSIPGLHGKVPRYPRISLIYQTLSGESMQVDAHGTWAALLQHECDHLDGRLYPSRMDDMSLLSFDDAPGALAEDAAGQPDQVDPLFLDLVERWPNREQWLSQAAD